MNSYQDPTSEELYRLSGNPGKLDFDAIEESQSNDISQDITNIISSGYYYMFNWTSMRYIHISPSIMNYLGYSNEFLLGKGFNFTLSLIHPSDFQHLRELHSAIFNYYYSIPVTKRANLRFSYNIRIKTSNNEYVHILRQSFFIGFTLNGSPSIEYVTNTDIPGFRSNSINLTIHQISDSGTYKLCYEQKFSITYPKLTEREKQVLELVKTGYTTKEIAYLLYLGIETVKSHRKHIIAKTGTHNMTAAINTILN
jgi:DNA-binding CsgD family transcriptional regulator